MDERTLLLNNALDALDRLFDREATAIDVYAILYATSRALPTDPISPLLNNAAASLLQLLREGLPTQPARDFALKATDTLRIALSESLD